MRRALLQVASLTALSQVAAFSKMFFVAHYFGVGPELDGYYLALIGPTLLAGVLGGVVQTGFFPVHARLRAEGKDLPARDFQSACFWMLLAACLAISSIMAVRSEWITSWLATGASDTVIEATALSLEVVGFILLFNTIVDYLGFVLAAHRRFALAAVAPAANALVGSVFLYGFPELGLYNLIWGTLLGASVQLALLLVGLRRSDIRIIAPWKLLSGAAHDVWEAAKLGAWILPGALFANLSAALPLALVAGLGDGAVSAFGYAQRLNSAIVQVLVMSLSTVLLAKFSEQVALGKDTQLMQSLARGFRLAFGVGLLITVWVWGTGYDILRVLLQRGRFDEQATAQVADLWFWLACGLFPAIWGLILAKFFQAQRRPGFMSLLAFVGLCVLWVSTRALSPLFGATGVALSASISLAVVTVVYHLRLLYELNCGAKRSAFSRETLRLPVATLIAAYVTVVALQKFFWHDWIVVRLLITTGVVLAGVYFVYSSATALPLDRKA